MEGVGVMKMTTQKPRSITIVVTEEKISKSRSFTIYATEKETLEDIYQLVKNVVIKEVSK